MTRKDFNELFKDITDGRKPQGKLHQLNDILFLCLVALVSGAEDVEEIVLFGKERIKWLRRYLPYNNGIPSSDTILRTLGLLKEKHLKLLLTKWVKLIEKDKGVNSEKGVISLDGKKLKGMSSKLNSNSSNAIYMVNAWSTELGLCLGSEKVDEKTNEITAIPSILETIDIKDKIVTVDALNTQVHIAEKVLEEEGDYLMAVKQNQKGLYQDVVEMFELESQRDFALVHYSKDVNLEKAHGFVTERTCQVISLPASMSMKSERWPELKKYIKVTSVRTNADGKESSQTRYFISSTEGEAKQFNRWVRDHWGVENSLHWVLDVIFKEDGSRIRENNAPENMAILRRLALNLIKNKKDKKDTIKGMRYKATMNQAFLTKIMFG